VWHRIACLGGCALAADICCCDGSLILEYGIPVFPDTGSWPGISNLDISQVRRKSGVSTPPLAGSPCPSRPSVAAANLVRRSG
jgi:hypothetical protein